MSAFSNHILLVAICLFAGSQQAISQGCNEIQFVQLEDSQTCPEEGKYSVPGDCESYITCICQGGILESFISSCSDGEIFVDGKCQKESVVQSCPQANCTETEVFSGNQKTYTYVCPTVVETTTTELPSKEASAGPAEKSISHSSSAAPAFAVSVGVLSLLYKFL